MEVWSTIHTPKLSTLSQRVSLCTYYWTRVQVIEIRLVRLGSMNTMKNKEVTLILCAHCVNTEPG